MIKKIAHDNFCETDNVLTKQNLFTISSTVNWYLREIKLQSNIFRDTSLKYQIMSRLRKCSLYYFSPCRSVLYFLVFPGGFSLFFHMTCGSILGISIDNYIQYWYVVDYVLFTLFPYLICLVDIQIIQFISEFHQIPSHSYIRNFCNSYY